MTYSPPTEEGTRGYALTTERTYDSQVLDRRIRLDKVPLLTDEDLRVFRLELMEASISIQDQLDALENVICEDGWVYRAKSKLRIVRLFITAAGEETERRLHVFRLEKERLKTERASKRARVIHDLLLQEWGEGRTRAFYDRASEIADALLAQEAA
jgi:uncharacterized membrane protein YheB (UPF0754 family)